jgi:hypothetical protein
MSQKKKMSSVVVGYRCEARKDAAEGLLTPKPRHKKQETIEAKLAEQMDLFEQKSPGLKLTGQIASVVAVDLTAGKVFDTSTLKKDGAWGVAFARWLLDTRGYRDAIPDRHHGGEYGVSFFGFNLKPFFRVLGVECNTNGFEVPLGLWYANDMCFDPYMMLTESEHGGLFREMFSLGKVLTRGGLNLGGDGNYVPGQSPKNDTRVVMELISRFRLTNTLDVACAGNALTTKAFSTQALDVPTGDPADADGADATVAAPKRKAARKKSVKKKGS